MSPPVPWPTHTIVLAPVRSEEDTPEEIDAAAGQILATVDHVLDLWAAGHLEFVGGGYQAGPDGGEVYAQVAIHPDHAPGGDA